MLPRLLFWLLLVGKEKQEGKKKQKKVVQGRLGQSGCKGADDLADLCPADWADAAVAREALAALETDTQMPAREQHRVDRRIKADLAFSSRSCV